MGIFSKKLKAYRVVANEKSSLKDDDLSVYEYFTVERRYTFFGIEKWKPIFKREYHGSSIKTFSTEKKAEAWIKLNLHKDGKRVVKVYESREDKINGLLGDA